MVSPPTPDERPHVDAMKRACEAGFVAAQMAGAVIHAEPRTGSGIPGVAPGLVV